MKQAYTKPTVNRVEMVLEQNYTNCKAACDCTGGLCYLGGGQYGTPGS